MGSQNHSLDDVCCMVDDDDVEAPYSNSLIARVELCFFEAI